MTKYNYIEVWLVQVADSHAEFVDLYREIFSDSDLVHDKDGFAIRTIRIWLQRRSMGARIVRTQDKSTKCRTGMLVAGNGKKLTRRW